MECREYCCRGRYVWGIRGDTGVTAAVEGIPSRNYRFMTTCRGWVVGRVTLAAVKICSRGPEVQG